MCPNGNADLTRSLILNAAVRIVSKDGLKALTAGRLITEAGVSKGGLYHHFRTMSDVEVEVLELISSKLLLSLQTYAQPTSKEEFLDTIEVELFDCLIGNDELPCCLFAYISEAKNNPPMQSLLRKFIEDVSLLRFQLLQNLKIGLTTVATQNIVEQIATMQLGLMTRFYLTEDQVSVLNYWRSCRTALAGLLSPQEYSEKTWERDLTHSLTPQCAS